MRENYLRSCCRSKMSLFICTPQQITLRLAEDIDLIDQTGLSHLPAKVSGRWHLFGSLCAQVKHYSCSIMQPSGYTADNTTSTRSSGEMKEMWRVNAFLCLWECSCLGNKKNALTLFCSSILFLKYQEVLSAYVCLCLDVLKTLCWCWVAERLVITSCCSYIISLYLICFQRQHKFQPLVLFWTVFGFLLASDYTRRYIK